MTAQTLTLADFLLARIAEDEAGYRRMAETLSVAKQTMSGPVGARPTVVHETILSRSRLLAECEAKRRIVEEHGNDYGDCTTCSDGDDGACGDPECCGPASAVMKSWPCPTIRLLALPYADHEDFDPEWRA
jgi:hypothetical protein